MAETFQRACGMTANISGTSNDQDDHFSPYRSAKKRNSRPRSGKSLYTLSEFGLNRPGLQGLVDPIAPNYRTELSHRTMAPNYGSELCLRIRVHRTRTGRSFRTQQWASVWLERESG